MSLRTMRRYSRRLCTSWCGTDNGTDGLGRAVEHFWNRGRDTFQITHALRRKGWDVTEAGVANALAWRRDSRQLPVFEVERAEA